MMREREYDSLLLLDKLLSKAYGQIAQLEEIEKEGPMLEKGSRLTGRVDVLLGQIYADRAAGNYKSAARKCLFLTGYIRRVLREGARLSK